DPIAAPAALHSLGNYASYLRRSPRLSDVNRTLTADKGQSGARSGASQADDVNMRVDQTRRHRLAAEVQLHSGRPGQPLDRRITSSRDDAAVTGDRERGHPHPRGVHRYDVAIDDNQFDRHGAAASRGMRTVNLPASAGSPPTCPPPEAIMQTTSAPRP